MRRIVSRLSALSVLACAPSVLFAQAKFEGVVTLNLSSPQGPTEMTYSVKGDQLRMDIAGRATAMYMIRDAAKNTMTIVLPAQRMYMEQAVPADMAARGMAEAEAKGKADVKMTGRKETIAGYECEHILITGDDGQYDVCGAKGLGSFMSANGMGGMRGRGAQASPTWQKLGEIFPLRVQKVGEAGPVLEVTKIEKKTLDHSLFQAPDDFQKMDMGAMRMGRPPR